MTATSSETRDRDRDQLVLCIGDAYEALRVIPGLDANGPALVWLAEHFLELRREGQQRDQAA
jgi:hypothetical protein